MSYRRPLRKTVIESGSRKSARASAIIRAGIGRVRVNGRPVELIEPEIARDVMLTPLMLAGGLRDHVDIDISVHGGGFMGQAGAVAMAISRSMAKWFSIYKLNPGIDFRARIMAYDKALLSGDSRQKESKKPGRVGARRRRQKSYR